MTQRPRVREVSELGSRKLPRPAQVLVIGMCLAGVVAFATSLHTPPRDGPACVLYVLLAFLASSQRLRMHPRVGTMSLGFLFVFAALFQCGTAAAIAAAVLGAVGGLLFANPEGRRQTLSSTFHAAGTLAVAAWMAGAAFTYLGPPSATGADLSRLLLPAAVAVTVYYALSVVSVIAVALVAAYGLPGRSLAECLWMAPVYFAGGAAALALHVAYREFGVPVFILGLPIIYVLHRSYAVRAEQTTEKLRHLEERTQASEKLAQLYMSVVEALSAAVEAKDQGTRLHVRRVQSLARAVGRRVGLEGDELQAVETAAVLHDIGKLAVPDHILSKPSRLTESEYELVRTHPEVGEAILRPIDFGADVGAIVRHHHEKMDGSGYPDGLAGEAIPMGARVLGVIDVYDALVSERPYRKAWRTERAIEYLTQHAGTAFDPRVVAALIEALESREVVENGERADEAPTASARALAGRGEPTEAADEVPPTLPDRRAQALQALAEELASRAPIHTCVVYEPDQRNAEIGAVAAAGEYAECFVHLRTPMGMGPSATAARAGRLVFGETALADVTGVTDEPPEGLAASAVAAVPVLTPSGQARAVVSLYSYLDAEVSDSLLAETALRAAEVNRELGDTLSEGTKAAAERESLLEYAAFLAALNREVARARETGGRLAVMAVGAHGPDGETERRLLLDLAQELRLCGRGQARVVEREAAGEIVAMFPPVIEATARECVQRFGEMARAARRAVASADQIRVAVGSAVFPDDVDSMHGLICVAEMRMARGGQAGPEVQATELLLPA